MADLLERRLAVFGVLGDSGLEPWGEDPPRSLARAVRELDAFDWRPMGGAWRIANTPVGDALARRLL
ncbi:hypothetical protein [Nocardiopsis trehalosi]|jgi:hypothetical protein|uniref:hypothetical protein n=1 Tax=Nocardiopsis trehalosi TaxID=109329 RepID=UPI00083769D8|nr:hypothetical protein [Nocardiopsis trehalosi]